MRSSIRIAFLAALAAPLVALPAFASDGRTLIDEVWARYRQVRTERQEREVLVVKSPPAQPFTRAAVEALVRDTPAAVARKRAVHHVRYAEDGPDRLHILFALPAEDAGLGLLVARHRAGAQDDMALYMPGYHRVRRIPASSDQKFAGTDLVYDDVRSSLGEHTETFDYTSPVDEELDGRKAKVVVATPKDGTPSAYARRKVWIDAEWLFPVRVELADKQGKPWKVLRNAEIHEVAPGVRRADLIEVRDVQRDSATVLLVTKRAVGLEIRPQVFTEDYLIHPGND